MTVNDIIFTGSVFRKFREVDFDDNNSRAQYFAVWSYMLCIRYHETIYLRNKRFAIFSKSRNLQKLGS